MTRQGKTVVKFDNRSFMQITRDKVVVVVVVVGSLEVLQRGARRKTFPPPSTEVQVRQRKISTT